MEGSQCLHQNMHLTRQPCSVSLGSVSLAVVCSLASLCGFGYVGGEKTNQEKEEGVLFCFVLLCCGCGCCVQLHVTSVFCVVVFCVVGCRCVRWLLCVDLATSMESKQTKKSKRAFCFVLCCCVVAVVAVCCALLV